MAANYLKEHLIWGMEYSFDHGKGIEANSLLDELKDLTAEQAAWSPPDGGHSIWTNVNHIVDWELTVWKIINNENPEITGRWPEPSEVSESAWQATLSNLKEIRANNLTHLRSLSDEQLVSQVDEKSDFDFNWAMGFTGLITHSAYHTGQILKLKELQGIEV